MRLLWLIPDNGIHLQTVVDFRIYRKTGSFQFFSQKLGTLQVVISLGIRPVVTPAIDPASGIIQFPMRIKESK